MAITNVKYGKFKCVYIYIYKERVCVCIGIFLYCIAVEKLLFFFIYFFSLLFTFLFIYFFSYYGNNFSPITLITVLFILECGTENSIFFPHIAVKSFSPSTLMTIFYLFIYLELC